MDVIAKKSISTLVDNPSPRLSQTGSPQRNGNKVTAGTIEQSRDYIGEIQPEQAREFLVAHLNRKLGVNISNSAYADRYNNFDMPVANELELENHLKEVISQSNLQLQDTMQLAHKVASTFTEVQEILANTGSLPETLQNEFTRIQYTLSDFVARLNQLANEALNTQSTAAVDEKGVMEIETREGKIIKIELPNINASTLEKVV